MRMLLRWSVVVVLVSLFLMAATSLLAAEPTGTSPDDGLAPICTYQPLGAGASVWLKVPYHFDLRQQFTLDSGGAGGIKFAVYASSTASSPVGVGTYDRNEPTHDLNWEGQLTGDGFFYVLVTNTNPFPASYQFCANEKLAFHPAAHGPCTFYPWDPSCVPGTTLTWEGRQYTCPGGWHWYGGPEGGSWGCPKGN